jgi:hypothetical protein
MTSLWHPRNDSFPNAVISIIKERFLPFLSVNVKSIPELVRLSCFFPRAEVTSAAVWFAVAWLPLGRARSGIRLVYVQSLQSRGVTGGFGDRSTRESRRDKWNPADDLATKLKQTTMKIVLRTCTCEDYYHLLPTNTTSPGFRICN